jgi:hypothetical protein
MGVSTPGVWAGCISRPVGTWDEDRVLAHEVLPHEQVALGCFPTNTMGRRCDARKASGFAQRGYGVTNASLRSEVGSSGWLAGECVRNDFVRGQGRWTKFVDICRYLSIFFMKNYFHGPEGENLAADAKPLIPTGNCRATIARSLRNVSKEGKSGGKGQIMEGMETFPTDAWGDSA